MDLLFSFLLLSSLCGSFPEAILSFIADRDTASVVVSMKRREVTSGKIHSTAPLNQEGFRILYLF